jgi:MinD-like ATPase involved in chromosome partitioning or flagellar assembly
VSAILQETACAFSQQGAIYLVPCSIKTGQITRILSEGYEVGLLNNGLQEIKRRFMLDYLFIDTHPGLNEETLLSIAISDLLVIVLRPDKQDYQGTAVTVEVARKLSVPNMILVVNKALPTIDFNSLSQLVSDIFQAPVGAVLPLCEDMVQLGSSAVFSLRFPDHPFSHKLKDIAELLG